MVASIPADLWNELKREGLMPDNAPVPHDDSTSIKQAGRAAA